MSPMRRLLSRSWGPLHEGEMIDTVRNDATRKRRFSWSLLLPASFAHAACIIGLAVVPATRPFPQFAEICLLNDCAGSPDRIQEIQPEAPTIARHEPVLIQESAPELASHEQFEEHAAEITAATENYAPSPTVEPVEVPPQAAPISVETEPNQTLPAAGGIEIETGDPGFWQLVRSAIARCVKYPSSARRSGADGFASVRMTIDADGRLLAATLNGSSADEFGRSALAAVHKAAPFTPSTNAASGAMVAVLPFRFVEGGRN